MMLHLSIFCLLLALAVAQNGYDYNKPDRQFGSTTTRPISPPTSTPYPIRPQSDDYPGSTTGYPSGPQNYPDSNQRPSPTYPSQGPRPSGPRGYPNGNYPETSGRSGNYPGGPDSNSIQIPQGPSATYPAQKDSPYPQGSRRPASNYPGQGSRYPGQPGNSPGGNNLENNDYSYNNGNNERGDYSAIPGEPDRDYPILSYIPQTSFNCKNQRYPGYYADIETRCQVFHVCANNMKYDFLCPNGTVFSQENFVCVWWNQFDCESALSLYDLNAKLYDFDVKSASNQGSNRNDYSESKYPGNRRPSDNYPGSYTPQGPTTPYPTVTLSRSRESTGYANQNGRYPGTQGSQNAKLSGVVNSYAVSQSPTAKYQGIQGPTGNYPNSQGYLVPESYSNSSQDQSSGTVSTSAVYPGSTTPYPGSGNQGYPSGRPSGPNFPAGRQVQPPHREYLPPRNKRAKQSKQ